MVRFLKYAGLLAAVLIGLLSVLLLAFVMIPAEKYKPLLSYGVEAATGRELLIEGRLDVKLGRTLTIEASGVKFANTAWGSRTYMLSVDTLAGEVALLPLFKGILDVSLSVDRPDVLLEKNTAGKGNWELGAVSTAEEEAASKTDTTRSDTSEGSRLSLRPIIRKIDIKNTHVVILNHNDDTRMTLSNGRLLVETTDKRLGIDFSGSFNDIPLAFAGHCDNARFLADNQATAVQIDGKAGKVELAVTGSVGPVAPAFDLDLALAVQADSLKAFSPKAAWDLPNFGPLSMTARLKGRQGTYSVEDIQALLRDDTLNMEVTGSLENAVAVEGLSLKTNIDTTELTAVAKVLGFNVGYALPDLFQLSAAVEGDLNSLALREFQAAIQGRGIRVDCTVEANNVMDLEGVSAELVYAIESLDLPADITGVDLPFPGPINGRVHVVSTTKNLELIEVQADIESEHFKASAVGSLRDPMKIKEVDAKITLGMTSFDWLKKTLAIRLPPMGSLQAAARIVSAGDALSLKDIQADLTGDDLSLQVNGSVGDVLKLQSVDATVVLTLRSLDFLSTFADTDLSSLGPLNATAVVGNDDGRFEITNFKADLRGQNIAADIAGSLTDIQKLTGIDVKFKVILDSLASLNILAKQKLPASEPVELTGKFLGEGGLKEPVNIDVSLESDGVEANVKGKIGDLLTIAGVDLAFRVEAESLAKAGKLAGVQLQSPDPLTTTGQFLTDKKAYRLSKLHLSAGKLHAQGDVAYQPREMPADRPRVNGRLQIGALDIGDLMLANKDPAQESGEKITPSVQEPENESEAVKEKVFTSQPLPFDWLRAVDVDLELALEKLMAPQWEMKDFSVTIDLENGLLRLAPVTAGLGRGSLKGAVMLDTGKSPAELTVDLNLKDATLRNLSGDINFLAELAGSGDSVAAIMAGLNGLVKLDIKDLVIEKSLVTDLATGFFNFLNPFGKEEKTTQVICAVVLFNIEDGIADARRKIVAQMEDVTWFGGGEINLKTEEISLGISPRSRKLLDIDLGELVSIGYLGGTLAQPKIALDPKDIAIKYGKYTAAIFTGGLSLLADQIWRKIEANQDVCDRILQTVEAAE